MYRAKRGWKCLRWCMPHQFDQAATSLQTITVKDVSHSGTLEHGFKSLVQVPKQQRLLLVVYYITNSQQPTSEATSCSSGSTKLWKALCKQNRAKASSTLAPAGYLSALHAWAASVGHDVTVAQGCQEVWVVLALHSTEQLLLCQLIFGGSVPGSSDMIRKSHNISHWLRWHRICNQASWYMNWSRK